MKSVGAQQVVLKKPMHCSRQLSVLGGGDARRFLIAFRDNY